jgi:hypothetical protein
MANTPVVRRGQRITGAERDRVGAELLKQYRNGRSIRQICQDTGYSIGRVRRLLIDAGVEFRARGGSNRGRNG